MFSIAITAMIVFVVAPLIGFTFFGSEADNRFRTEKG